MYFDARVILVDVFVEVGFDDAVVVEAEPLTEGILRDLEPPIHVSSEARRKIKSDREGEPLGVELCHQGCLVRRLHQFQPDDLSHVNLIGAPSSREQSSSVHRGILMVYAGRNREGQDYPIVSGLWL